MRVVRRSREVEVQEVEECSGGARSLSLPPSPTLSVGLYSIHSRKVSPRTRALKEGRRERGLAEAAMARREGGRSGAACSAAADDRNGAWIYLPCAAVLLSPQ